MDLFRDQKGIDFPTEGLRRNSFDKNYPMQEHHTTCKTTIWLRRYSFDKNYPMHEHLRHARRPYDYDDILLIRIIRCTSIIRHARRPYDYDDILLIRIIRCIMRHAKQGKKTHTAWKDRKIKEGDQANIKGGLENPKRITNIILRITFSRPTHILQNALQPFYTSFTSKYHEQHAMRMSCSQAVKASSASSSSSVGSPLKAPAEAPTTPHAAMHWSACFNDRCDVHLRDKEGANWFPKPPRRNQPRRQGTKVD